MPIVISDYSSFLSAIGAARDRSATVASTAGFPELRAGEWTRVSIEHPDTHAIARKRVTRRAGNVLHFASALGATFPVGSLCEIRDDAETLRQVVRAEGGVPDLASLDSRDEIEPGDRFPVQPADGSLEHTTVGPIAVAVQEVIGLPDTGDSENANKILGFDSEGRYAARNAPPAGVSPAQLRAVRDAIPSVAAFLDRAGVDGRVTALVAAWALASNTQTIPDAKLSTKLREIIDSFEGGGVVPAGGVTVPSAAPYTIQNIDTAGYMQQRELQTLRQTDVWIGLKIPAADKASVADYRLVVSDNMARGYHTAYKGDTWTFLEDASGESYYQVQVSDIPVGDFFGIQKLSPFRLKPDRVRSGGQ